jgi:tRNA-specific adenosine deaminase 3
LVLPSGWIKIWLTDHPSALSDLNNAGNGNTLQHLRRAAKPGDLPAHLKTQFMNDSAAGRQIHTAKSTWVYILIGETDTFTPQLIRETMSGIQGFEQDIFLESIPVPQLAPSSQVQASLWSSQFWPCVYRKSNPLGPHPSAVARDTDEIRHDASAWMTLAHKVARQAQAAGIGEPIGAVIVQRSEGKVEVVGLAGDARWHRGGRAAGGLGNPMAHCVLRAISMVAQKLVRHERKEKGIPNDPAILEFDALEDQPILDLEKTCFETEHPNTGGYLCHGLELYVTHEPCVQCSMAILHSRMGRMVFCQHMPHTGGLSSDDRPNGGGRGLGLFWRRELNWSALAWEWEREGVAALPPIAPTTHV